MGADKLVTALLRAESVLLPLDFKRIAIVGILLLLIGIERAPDVLELVELPKLSPDSALRIGALWTLASVVSACLYILYKRQRAYYSTAQRFLARACVLGATGVSFRLLWEVCARESRAVVDYWYLANPLFGLLAAAGAAWIIQGLARDCSTPADYTLVVCELDERGKPATQQPTYLGRTLVDELKSQLRGEEHQVRLEYLSEVVDSDKRARRLGTNARARAIVYGYVIVSPPTSAKLFTTFEVLSTPRVYPGAIALKRGAVVDLQDFGVYTGLKTGTLCLSYFLLGLVYYWDKMYDRAVSHLATAQELLRAEITELGLQEVLLYRGNALYRLERYEEAAKVYTEAISEEPSFARAYNNRGACYGELGKTLDAQRDGEGAGHYFELALQDLANAVDKDSDLVVAWLDMGRINSWLRRYEEASANYTKVIARNADDPDLYLYRGEARARLGQYDQAIGDYSRVIGLQPNNPFAWIDRAGCYHELGNYDQAIRDYTRLIKLAPAQIHVAFAERKLADLYGEKKEHKKATKHYSEAIKLSPSDPILYTNRGIALLEQTRLKDAMDDFRKAIALDPKLAQAHDGLGKAHFHLGQYEMARSCFQKAADLEPGFKAAILNLQATESRLALA